jgi:hypothetical protein
MKTGAAPEHGWAVLPRCRGRWKRSGAALLSWRGRAGHEERLAVATPRVIAAGVRIVVGPS